MYKISCTLGFLLFFVAATLGQAPARGAAAENTLHEELRRAAPSSVDVFIAATNELDANNFAEADRLFAEVLAKAPDFEAALRRRGYALTGLGRRDEGLELTQKALLKNRSVDNLVGRASVLMTPVDPNSGPSAAESSEAATLSREAWQKSSGSDEHSGVLLSESLIASQQIAEFEKFAPEFRNAFPDSPAAGYYNSLVLANRGEFDAAEKEIGRIKALGVPEESVAPLLTAINDARDEAFFGLGRYVEYAYLAAGIVVLWAVGLLALFIGGRILSTKTLRSIEGSDPNDVTGSEQSSVKKLYRRIIAVAGAYYYISQPFVIFLVIAATGAIILIFLWIGTIPIKLVAVLAIVALLTVFYMIKSLFTRVKAEDPGRALTEAEAPELWRLVRGVAETINTRPVDEIRLTHGTDLAVYERGTFRAKMSDNAERILIIGTAVLNGFDQNAFRAVLAHEYGHFSNRDTAGGDIAYRVNVDIVRTAESMAAGGTATFYNLGFQFLRLFHFLFRRITLGASRLQEILADRVAAYHYGAQSFREGLNHVIRRELEFGHVADKEISSALGANRALQNLYEMSVNEESALIEIDEAFKAAVDCPTTDDDSHPSPRDRFRFIEKIRSAEAEPLNGEVWDLFADSSAVKAEMNEVIEKLVRGRYEPSGGGILNIG